MTCNSIHIARMDKVSWEKPTEYKKCNFCLLEFKIEQMYVIVSTNVPGRQTNFFRQRVPLCKECLFKLGLQINNMMDTMDVAGEIQPQFEPFGTDDYITYHIVQLINENKYVRAIKEYRHECWKRGGNCSLHDAKYKIESYIIHNQPKLRRQE